LLGQRFEPRKLFSVQSQLGGFFVDSILSIYI